MSAQSRLFGIKAAFAKQTLAVLSVRLFPVVADTEIDDMGLQREVREKIDRYRGQL